MPFNSIIFLIFGAFFFALWPFAKKTDTRRWIYITAASLLFYGWWDWRFIFLLLGAGLIDYLAGRAMVAWPAHKRYFLFASLAGNLGSLSVFKYSGFIADNIGLLLSAAGYPCDLTSRLPEFTLILPVGISFFTFQSMSYTIDVYLGRMKPVTNLFHFFAFLSMFPQLVAGPIVRARDLIPQLEKNRATTEEERWDGLKLIVGGYFKKVVIADNLAPFVNAAFAAVPSPDSTLYWWLVVSAFAFQIFFDFGGYSDIARGLAKWMGYDFLVNFDHPYTSTSMREFWARWHISLSTWFRDYVYFPLGGSKKGDSWGHVNMWLTMVISGLWHGAAFHFLAWGAVHALFLSIERITLWPERLKKLPGGSVLALTFVLFQVLIAWVFFRAQDITQAFAIIGTMLEFNGRLGFPTNEAFKVGVLYLSLGMGMELCHFSKIDIRTWFSPAVYRAVEVASVAILMALSVFFRGAGMQFIYFQF
jgi:D-alanyl-lipoteichoic acid acyltransferase DltB (MBOAT superfamily)